MEFELSQEEKLFREAVSEFAKRYIEPSWVEIDEKGRIPVDLIKRMGDQGLFAIPVPEKFGGGGGTYRMAALAVEEVAYHDPSVATAVYMLLNNGWPYVLYLFGGEDAASTVIPEVAKGRAFLGIASTEPHGGSDVAGITTTARRAGGKWVVSGEKVYISGVREVMEDLPNGGGWILLAKTEKPERDHRRITAFLALGRWGGEKAKGIDYSLLTMVGRHGLSTGILKFSEYEVEDSNVVGEVNRGFYIVHQGFNLARILVAAATIGAARWALDRALEWIRERKLFGGKPIASFQGVSFRFAELYTELEAAKLLVYRAAWLADKIYSEKDPAFKPQDLNVPAAMAKLKAPEVAVRVFEEVLKWMGAFGYSKEGAVYRGWLGVTSYVVGAEGAQNIMRYIIARDTIGREYVKA
ncbi:MAG: acyl-CoA dehydrogenase family protein [Thermoproteota archaeon]